MKSGIISVDTTVDVDVADVVDRLDYDDICEWFLSLASVERGEFLETFGGTLQENNVPVSALVLEEDSLEDALKIVVDSYRTSPYLRGIIDDRFDDEHVR